MDRDFGFQLGDTPASRGQLSVLAAGPAGQLPGVDQMLPAPDIDCLLADSQIGGDLSHRTASCDQIKNLAAELGGIPLRHRSGDPLGSEDRDHPVTRLHSIRGTSGSPDTPGRFTPRHAVKPWTYTTWWDATQ